MNDDDDDEDASPAGTARELLSMHINNQRETHSEQVNDDEDASPAGTARTEAPPSHSCGCFSPGSSCLDLCLCHTFSEERLRLWNQRTEMFCRLLVSLSLSLIKSLWCVVMSSALRQRSTAVRRQRATPRRKTPLKAPEREEKKHTFHSDNHLCGVTSSAKYHLDNN